MAASFFRPNFVPCPFTGGRLGGIGGPSGRAVPDSSLLGVPPCIASFSPPSISRRNHLLVSDTVRVLQIRQRRAYLPDQPIASNASFLARPALPWRAFLLLTSIRALPAESLRLWPTRQAIAAGSNVGHTWRNRGQPLPRLQQPLRRPVGHRLAQTFHVRMPGAEVPFQSRDLSVGSRRFMRLPPGVPRRSPRTSVRRRRAWLSYTIVFAIWRR